MVFGRARSRVAAAAQVPLVLARSGLLKPGSPAATARQLNALARWGNTLAGTTIAGAARDADRPALVDASGALTYAELDARTNRLARSLADVPRVGLLSRNHRGMVESLIACSKLGVRPVVLDTGQATPELLAALDGVDALIADAEFEPLLAAAPGSIRKLVAEDLPYAADSRAPRPTRKGRTDGAESLTAILSRIPLHVHETTLIGAPLSARWGRASLQLALGLRSTVVLTRRYDPSGMLAAVEKHRCSALFTASAMLRRFLDLDPALRESFDLSSLKVAATQGSALPSGLAPAFMDEFGEILYTVYGSALTIATPRELRDRPDTAGRPAAGVRLQVLREDGSRALPCQPGQIFAHSGRVGDVGHVDSQGRLFVKGRPDEMVFSGDEAVATGEIETVIKLRPEVRDVAVVGVPDAQLGQRLAAFVVLKAGSEKAGPKIDGETVRDWVGRRFVRFAVPSDVHFLDALPRTATGRLAFGDLPGLA